MCNVTYHNVVYSTVQTSKDTTRTRTQCTREGGIVCFPSTNNSPHSRGSGPVRSGPVLSLHFVTPYIHPSIRPSVHPSVHNITFQSNQCSASNQTKPRTIQYIRKKNECNSKIKQNKNKTKNDTKKTKTSCPLINTYIV